MDIIAEYKGWVDKANKFAAHDPDTFSAALKITRDVEILAVISENTTWFNQVRGLDLQPWLGFLPSAKIIYFMDIRLYAIVTDDKWKGVISGRRSIAHFGETGAIVSINESTSHLLAEYFKKYAKFTDVMEKFVPRY